MIPTQIVNDLATLQASVLASTPLGQQTPLLKAALVAAGMSLVAEIDDGLQAAGAPLDAGDPSGFPGDLIGSLMELAVAATDQACLADMRGTVGRAVFNLDQA